MNTKEQSASIDRKQMDKQEQVKRPMNAFMLWSKEKRRKISSIDPSLHNSHISKILGEEWKRLPVNDKEPYIQESRSLMEKHKKEHPDYHYKPRQNKLAKALKELSSLHSPLPSSPMLASRLRSSLSAFAKVPTKAASESCQTFCHSQIFHKLGRGRDGVPYHDVPPCYPPSMSCRGCFRGSSCPDNYWTGQSSYSCTCNMECSDNLCMAGYRHLSYQRSSADFYDDQTFSPTLYDRPANSLRAWRHHLHPQTYTCIVKDSTDEQRSSICWNEGNKTSMENGSTKSRSPNSGFEAEDDS